MHKVQCWSNLKNVIILNMIILIILAVLCTISSDIIDIKGGQFADEIKQ